MCVLQTMRKHMPSARNVQSIRSALDPEHGAQVRVWNRIRERIAPSRARGLLEQVRTYLTPEHGGVVRIGRGFLPQLQPVAVPARPLKWVAAFAIVIVALRASPLLFLAPQTAAESNVLLFPTRGEVSIALRGFLQPIEDELELLQSTTVHTANGEATILLHDDGTIRLAENTQVTLQDLTDRPEKGSGLATLLLTSGTVWMQGLIPDHLQGLSVVTPRGVVTVHGGSVSITVQGTDVTVESWDRHARFEREEQADIIIVSGERLIFHGEEAPRIERMGDAEFDREWPSQNLQRDAVHQRVIAQQQRERIAARAGILPTSRLYGVKRLAEEVDVLLTFDHETAVKKRLAQATTRLNEATTLIAGGESGATVQLQEYQDAVLSIAKGSGDTLTQRLVEQGVAENAAQLSAQLPDDTVYVVKRLVLDTSTQLPMPPIDAADVEASVIGDAVDALQIATVEGDQESLQRRLDTLAPYIEDLPEHTGLDPTTKKEVISQLSRVADSLQDDARLAEGSGAVVLRAMSRVVRTHVPVGPPPAHLTEEQILDMVDAMLDRIFVYRLYTGQSNQLHHEIRQLRGHPDEGMILRVLYGQFSAYEEVNRERVNNASPDFRLSALVRGAIQDLRERQALID